MSILTTFSKQGSDSEEGDRRAFIRGAALGLAGIAVARCGVAASGADLPWSENDGGMTGLYPPRDAGGGRDAGEWTTADAGTGVADAGPGALDAGTFDTGHARDAGLDAGPDAGVCRRTDANIRGPFYRAGAPNRTVLASANEPGQRIVIAGRVTGPDCRTPIDRAVVDVWQADSGGAYDNASTAYRLRGVMLTGAIGLYSFESIFPGYYLNGANYRPAHIHYTISAPGYRSLTTQLYFEGDPYIPIDPFVLPSLIIPLDKRTSPWRGTFDIVLGR